MEVKTNWEVCQNLMTWAICKLLLWPSLRCTETYWNYKKKHRAASAQPGMIASSVVVFFFFFFSSSLSWFASFVVSLNPAFKRMAACQMWEEPYLDLMILQMPRFMPNNNSVVMDTQLSVPYLDTNRLVCHPCVESSISAQWWSSFAVPNHLSHWERSEADRSPAVQS